MQSMTGYGESILRNLDGISIFTQIRSYNSKTLDIQTNIPEALNWAVFWLEDLIRHKFSRGRFVVQIIIEEKEHSSIELNISILQSYKKQFCALYNKPDFEISPELLVHLPKALKKTTVDKNILKAKFEFYFMRALLKTEVQRKKEGRKVIQSLKKALRTLLILYKKVKKLSDSNVSQISHNLMDRYLSLLKGLDQPARSQVSEKRYLSQSIWKEFRADLINALYVDVTEELERISMYIEESLFILDDSKSSSKKLEFYVLELLREVNTLAAKTTSIHINKESILMKLEVDKMREQIRNLE